MAAKRPQTDSPRNDSAVTDATPHQAPARRTPRAARPRRVSSGDIGPTRNAEVIEGFAVRKNVANTQQAEIAALQDILAGRSPEDVTALLKSLLRQHREIAHAAGNAGR